MNISDANLNLIISIAVILIAITPVWKDVYNNTSQMNFYKRFTRIGKVLIVTSFIFIMVNYFKDTSAEKKVNKAEREKNEADSIAKVTEEKLSDSQDSLQSYQQALYKLQLSVKDTILESIDSSYRKSIKASNDALIKYHIKIIDSLHTVVGTLKLNALHPQLAIAPVSNGHDPVFLERKGSDTLKIQLVSAGGTSYNIQLDAYFILESGNIATLLEKENYGNGQTFVNEGVISTAYNRVNQKLLLLPKVLVVLNGSFSKDPDGKEIVPYLQSFDFNFRDNNYIGNRGIPLDRFKELANIK